MRFPERARLAAAAALLIAGASHAAPDTVRAGIASRLQAALPGVPAADYAWGPGAADAELRAEIQSHAAEAAATARAGKALWDRRFKDGKSLASCFPNGGRRIAAAYPQYNSRLKRVITLETAINQCLKAHGEALLDAQEPQMAQATAYLRSLSDGQKVAVRVPASAEERFSQGQRMYFARMGQRNFACASCHVQGAGKRYGDMPLSPVIGQATHWPIVRGGVPVTLQMKIRECLELMGAAPFPAGSDELNHLEYFLTYLSNGMPLKANAWRPKEGH